MEYDDFDDHHQWEDDARHEFDTDETYVASSRPAGSNSGGRKIGCWVAAFVGGALVVLTCCGGILALGLFGLNMMDTEIEREIRDNPVIVEHIGEIQSFETDWMASFTMDDDDVYVFQIEGTKGSGEIAARCLPEDDGSWKVESGTLRLSSGEKHDLFDNQ